MRRSSITISTAVVAALALSACGKPAPPSHDTSSAVKASDSAAAVAAARAGDAAVLAAAEPFEKLTETSFSATLPILDGTIAEVQSAAAGLKGILSHDAITRLNTRLAEIATARKADNRADLAIAAVEGYRVLVSAAGADAKVPTAVKLLDYAGFRYEAHRQAKPSRWDEMTQAVTFGRDQWASIAPRVTDAALRERIEMALADMASAANGRDAAGAAAAAQRELALVDDLEKFFATR